MYHISSKHYRSCLEAFKEAQQSVLNDPATAAPYYWASFILLDAY